MNRLFLFAHPDDEFFIYSYLKRSIRMGDNVSCLYITNGEAYGCSATQRLEESFNALKQIGVLKTVIHSVGAPDGKSFLHLNESYETAQGLLKKVVADELVIPAWEGGHPDHDAVHLLGQAIAKGLFPGVKVVEYPLYSGRGRGKFFRVLSLVPRDAKVISHSLSLQEGMSHFCSMRFYRSQWKTFLGLGPEAFWRLVVLRREETREVQMGERDYRSPPAKRPLFYEKRFGVTFEEFVRETGAFIDSHRLSPPNKFGG